MKKNVFILATVSIMVAFFVGCSDDSVNDGSPDSLEFDVKSISTDDFNDEVGKGQPIPGQYIVVYNTDFGKSMGVNNAKAAM